MADPQNTEAAQAQAQAMMEEQAMDNLDMVPDDDDDDDDVADEQLVESEEDTVPAEENQPQDAEMHTGDYSQQLAEAEAAEARKEREEREIKVSEMQLEREVKELTTQVNWDVFDSMVMDYALSEGLINGGDGGVVASEETVRRKRMNDVIGKVRSCIELGHMEEALSVVSHHAPTFFENLHFLFRFQKQKLVEMLRLRHPEDTKGVLEDFYSCRGTLAKTAMNAYPEAFLEFRNTLLTLIYAKDDEKSPVTEQWSEKRRIELAALIASTLKRDLRAHDPCFLQTLKYLLRVHKEFCEDRAFASIISYISQKLQLEEKDPPVTVQESLFEAPNFEEREVQTLLQSVKISREEAIDSLRYTVGNVQAAFQNELSRRKLNTSIVDDLVHEYCTYRGLIEDLIEQTEGDVESTSGDVVMEDIPDSCLGGLQNYSIDNEVRPLDNGNNREDCSTSKECQIQFDKLRSNKRNLCNLPRWMGRCCEASIEKTLDGSSTKEQESTNMVNLQRYNVQSLQILWKIRDLISKGMIEKVVDHIKEVSPNFFDQNPALLFQLKQVEFLTLLEDGNPNEALVLAQRCLSPLALNSPALTQTLKDTVVALANPIHGMSRQHISQSVASSIQVVLGASMGIEEPLLMKIMRSTIYAHKEFFNIQKCTDMFEESLKINELKDTDSIITGALQSESKQDSVSGQETGINLKPSEAENGIVKVMEFLGITRSHAIELIKANGSAEAAIQNAFF